MKTLRTKSALGLIILWCSISGLSAQDRERTGNEDLLTAKSVNYQEYRPTISDAQKLGEVPTVIDTTMPKPVPTYVYGAKPVETHYTPDSISAASMKAEPLDPLYRAYVRGGGGNGVNYLFDGYVNTVRSRDASLELDLHGRGFQGNLLTAPSAPTLPFAPYNRWNGNLAGTKFFKKHSWEGNAGYDRERVQYYGFDDTNPYYFDLPDDNFKQVYHRIYANTFFRSFNTDSAKFNYTLGGHYDRFMDVNAANGEHNAVLQATGAKFFGDALLNVGLIADMNNVQYADSFDFNPYGMIPKSQTSLIMGLRPTISKVVYQHKIKYEVGLNVQTYTLNGTTPMLYPFAYAKWNLVKEIIIPYVGVEGGLKRNNLNNLSETNPFLQVGLTPLKPTDMPYKAYGGFRGAFTKTITYNLHFAMKEERNSPLFINYNGSQFNPGLNRFGENYFMVIYNTIKTSELGGELTYRVGEKLQLLGSGNYRIYKAKNEYQAWQRPIFDAAISGFYAIDKKIKIKTQVNVIGPRHVKGYKAYVPNDTEAVTTETVEGVLYSVTDKTLNPIFDLNLGVEYRYTERLSAFVNLNNIAAQRYQRWNMYPSQRLNVMGGISYIFWKE